MLFQMLAGVLPFQGDSLAELMYKIANEPTPDMRTIRAELPEKLANIVVPSSSRQPDVRYQNGDQFAVKLRVMMGAAADLANPTNAAPSVSSQGGVAADAANFDTTVVQSAIACEATWVMQNRATTLDTSTLRDKSSYPPKIQAPALSLKATN